MKLLVICQYYYPEPFRITDICEELVRRGNEVTVVTGTPNYPMGRIYSGYEHGKKRDEIINGVTVHRCFTIGRRSGAFWRFLNYYSYSIASTMYVAKLGADFGSVFVNQLSPVMMARAGIKYKKQYGAKLILYCLDLWPESLVAGGIKRSSVIYKLYQRVSQKIYAQADSILITSKQFAGYLEREFDISQERIQYLPQYAENIFDSLPPAESNKKTTDLVFAGNIGVAQSVQTIIRAAAILQKDYPQLRWHIVGDGSEMCVCQSLAKDLGVSNVVFYGRKPLEDMPSFYALADAMLVTLQDEPYLSMTLPGKVQSYLAAGKPIIGAANGETVDVISEATCGYCCQAEDYRGLAGGVRSFIADTDKAALAANAAGYYNSRFNRDDFFDKLRKSLATTSC